MEIRNVRRHFGQDVYKRQIEPRRVQLLQPLAGHPGVKVAHAARVQLDDLRAGARDGVRVDVGVDIRLHHAHRCV